MTSTKLNSFRSIYLSTHIADTDPRYLAKLDLDKIEKQLVGTNAEVVLINARGHVGNCYYNTKIGHKHQGLGETDFLQEMVVRLHKHGIEVPAYYSCVWDRRSYHEHSDWRQVMANGQPRIDGNRRACCPNSPYRDYARSLVEEIVANYDIDGFMFDMAMFNNISLDPKSADELLCYCEYCQKTYYDFYGEKLPDEIDWNNPNFRRFIQFRYDSIYRFTKHLVDGVKSIKPDLPVYLQYFPLKGNWVMGQPIKVTELADFLLSDIYFFRSGYLRMSVNTKLMRSISKRKQFEVHLMGRPGKHDDAPNVKTLDQLRGESFTILANGGAVGLFDIMWPDGTLQDRMWEMFGQIHQEIEEREEWLGGQPVKDVALYFSETTRDYFGKTKPEDRYFDEFYGIASALLEEQIAFEILTEEQLQNENIEFKALVLPNTACFSDKEITKINDYVKNGGLLLVTGYTSLFDGEGNSRDNFGLAEVFGINYLGQLPYSRTFFKLTDSAFLENERSELLTSWGPQLDVEVTNSEVLATTSFPFVEENGDVFASAMCNPPTINTNKPFMLKNNYGKGQVIYFANLIGYNYVHKPFLDTRKLIANSLRTLLMGEMTVEVKAPRSVEVNAYQLKEKNCLSIHLVNLQTEVGRNYISANGENRHLIHEVLPVYDLKLNILTGDKKVKTVKLQPGDNSLNVDIQDNYVHIQIPRLDIHSIVVVEWA